MKTRTAPVERRFVRKTVRHPKALNVHHFNKGDVSALSGRVLNLQARSNANG